MEARTRKDRLPWITQPHSIQFESGPPPRAEKPCLAGSCNGFREMAISREGTAREFIRLSQKFPFCLTPAAVTPGVLVVLPFIITRPPVPIVPRRTPIFFRAVRWRRIPVSVMVSGGIAACHDNDGKECPE